MGLHPTPDQGGLLVLSSLDAPWRPQRSWKPLVLIGKFAIAFEGCVPAPAKASLPSMARLTQFTYSPCGNSEGMVYSCYFGVVCDLLKKIYMSHLSIYARRRHPCRQRSLPCQRWIQLTTEYPVSLNIPSFCCFIAKFNNGYLDKIFFKITINL